MRKSEASHISNDPLEFTLTGKNDGFITYICENTDCVLDPLEQIKYSLNEVQLSYGSVVVLKDAP
jgi:hypothetical protein